MPSSQTIIRIKQMVGPGRLELPTPRLSSVCSNQLSYGPIRGTGRRGFCLLEERETWTARLAIPSECQRHFRGVLRFDGHLTGAIYVLKSGFCVAWIPCPSRLRSKGIQAGHTATLAKIGFLRKEVIQPQVPLRLPCYDFTPVADPTVVACLLAVSTPPSGKTNSHGVTGGVYKARERIHRGMLIRDY